jgi:hypothetical protein
MGIIGVFKGITKDPYWEHREKVKNGKMEPCLRTIR